MQKTLLLRNHIWWVTARPKTLIASSSPVFIGSVIALNEGFFSWTTFLFTLTAALFIQVGTNFANDYYDFIKGCDLERTAGPKRGLHLGLLSLRQMKGAYCIAFTIAFTCSLYLSWVGGLVLLGFSLLAPIIGIGYTRGRFALAYTGLADPVVLLFFGPIAVILTYYLQTHTWSWIPLIAGLAPGFISTALLAIANVRDIDEDRKVGKQTVPVRFGKWFGLCEYAFFLFSAPLIPIFLTALTKSHYYSLCASLLCLPAVFLIRQPSLPKTTLFFLVYTLLFCLGWYS